MRLSPKLSHIQMVPADSLSEVQERLFKLTLLPVGNPGRHRLLLPKGNPCSQIHCQQRVSLQPRAKLLALPTLKAKMKESKGNTSLVHVQQQKLGAHQGQRGQLVTKNRTYLVRSQKVGVHRGQIGQLAAKNRREVATRHRRLNPPVQFTQ